MGHENSFLRSSEAVGDCTHFEIGYQEVFRHREAAALHDATWHPRIRTNHNWCHPIGVAAMLAKRECDEVCGDRRDRRRQVRGGEDEGKEGRAQFLRQL